MPGPDLRLDFKVKMPADVAAEIHNRRDVLLHALIPSIMNQLPAPCCPSCGETQVHASVLTTGFLMLAAGLSRMTVPVREQAVRHALAAIERELLGGGVPVNDPKGAH